MTTTQVRTEDSHESFEPMGRHLADPYPFFARARAREPIFFAPSVNAWCVTRYEDIAAIVDDVESFSSAEAFPRPKGLPPEADDWLEWFYEKAPPITFLDPPTHTRVRRVMNRGFMPRALSAFEPDVRAVVERYVLGVVGRDEFDLAADLAAPMPVNVIIKVLGFPDEDYPRLKVWFDHIFVLLVGSHMVDRETLAVCGQGFRDWRAYVSTQIDEREAAPRDDLMSFLIHGDAHGHSLTRDEVMMQIITMIAAGGETTGNGLINTVYALMRNRRHWDALVAGEADVDAIIEEGLRLNTSVLGLFRTAKRDVTLSGVTIPEGAMVFLLWGSANHDESRYDRPTEFRPGERGVAQDLTFGRGIHYCIGAPLARMEMRIALEALARHMPGLHLASDEPPAYRPITQFRALESLVLRP